MTTVKISSITRFMRSHSGLRALGGLAIAGLLLGITTAPALAHHPLGGMAPATLWQGLMSGLAHPVIGLDHLAFIVAVGLLAASRPAGFWIPVAFVGTAMVGTGLHLTNLTIPGVELVVAGSVLGFGLLLACKNNFNARAIAGLAALLGLFHGYAYGEAIFGAEMTPLLAYLAGFTIIQLAISLAVLKLAKATISDADQDNRPRLNSFRSAGLVIFGVGLAFFGSQVLGLILPA